MNDSNFGLVFKECQHVKEIFWERLKTEEDLVAATCCAWDAHHEIVKGLENPNVFKSYFAAYVFYGLPQGYRRRLEDGLKAVVIREEDVSDFWQRLESMELISKLKGILKHVFEDALDLYTKEKISGIYDEPVYSVVLKKWKERYAHILSHQDLDRIYMERRYEELYEIITDYPDSIAATIEIRSALIRSGQQYDFGKRLGAILKQRLLHAGASTGQIIDVYISSLKCIRVIGLNQYVVGMATDSIRYYLRSREDTVRCIVFSLTNTRTQSHDRRESKIYLPDFYGKNDIDLEPGLLTGFMNQASGSEENDDDDVLPTLMSIYGSSRVFVSEFKRMLASKLLESHTMVDFDDQVRKLELLKLRFGESPLDDCEVMLRDFQESTRLMTQAKFKPDVLSVTIVSTVFWPKHLMTKMSTNKKFQAHPHILDLQEKYASFYNEVKAPRRLDWYPDLGSVEIEIEFTPQQSERYIVSPLEASLILIFQDTDEISLNTLAATFAAKESFIRDHMTIWITNGIISYSDTHIYTLNTLRKTPVNSIGTAGNTTTAHPSDNDATHSADNEMLKSYILGMMKNLGSLNLESVHNMLQLFLNEDSDSHMTTTELASLLDLLCADELIENNAGFYSLRGGNNAASSS